MQRYTIEVRNKHDEKVIRTLTEQSIKIIDKFDPFEKLGADVEKMGNAMRKFKNSGVSWDVFNYYLRGKGIPQQTIDAVLGEVKQFFIKVGLMDKK